MIELREKRECYLPGGGTNSCQKISERISLRGERNTLVGKTRLSLKSGA